MACCCGSEHPDERGWAIGDRIHGFASGGFGRDSYGCRTVEAVGRDWVVTRNDAGVAEFASDYHVPRREDAAPGVYCSCPEEDP